MAAYVDISFSLFAGGFVRVWVVGQRCGKSMVPVPPNSTPLNNRFVGVRCIATEFALRLRANAVSAMPVCAPVRLVRSSMVGSDSSESAVWVRARPTPSNGCFGEICCIAVKGMPRLRNHAASAKAQRRRSAKSAHRPYTFLKRMTVLTIMGPIIVTAQAGDLGTATLPC